MPTTYDIQAAIDNFDLVKARRLVREALDEEPSVELYILAAEVASTDEDRQYYLEQAVELDPFNPQAEEALNRLMQQEPTTTPPPPQPQPTIRRNVQYASFGSRFMALIIDGVLLSVINTVLLEFYALISAPPMPQDFATLRTYDEALISYNLEQLIVSFFIGVLYYGLLYTQLNGATIGKKLVGIRVIRLDGQPFSWGTVFMREYLGKFISTLPLLLGFFWALSDKHRQAWHDKIAQTIVIQE